MIVVRARCRDHLEALLEHHNRLFFDAEIIDTPDRDYPHRIVTDDVTWGMFLTAVAAEMDYDNFKEAAGRMVHDPEYEYDERLHDVWETMNEFLSPPHASLSDECRKSRNEAEKFGQGIEDLRQLAIRMRLPTHASRWYKAAP